MRTIICGSRTITNRKLLQHCILKLGYDITTVLCGNAKGVDTMGKEYGIDNHIPVELYPADWSKGKWAGFERNITMVNNCDSVLAIWDGKSNGTKHTIEYARKLGKPCRVFIYE